MATDGRIIKMFVKISKVLIWKIQEQKSASILQNTNCVRGVDEETLPVFFRVRTVIPLTKDRSLSKLILLLLWFSFKQIYCQPIRLSRFWRIILLNSTAVILWPQAAIILSMSMNKSISKLLLYASIIIIHHLDVIEILMSFVRSKWKGLLRQAETCCSAEDKIYKSKFIWQAFILTDVFHKER